MSLSVITAGGLNQTSESFSPPTAFSSGDDVIIVISEINTPNTASGTLSDSAGNTWTIDGALYVNATLGSLVCAFHANGVAAGSPTITYAAQSTSYAGLNIAVIRVSGGPIALDLIGSSATGSSSIATTANITPSANGGIVIGAGYGQYNYITWSSPTNSFTDVSSLGTTAPIAYLADSGDSAIDVSWTLSGSISWETGILAYKVATAPPASQQGLFWMLP